MCGIAGVVARPGRGVDAAALARALAALVHRGPDDEGTWTADHRRAALGSRRLSVIDVEGGRQPIANEDGTIHLILNGEIYNFAELRADLEARGHTFRTGSDVEPVLHLYEDEGVRCVERLRGMFALALWDDRRRRLLLARDRLGKKPLIWGERPEGLVFASELGAVRAGWGAGEIDLEALDAFLALGAVPAPRTIEQAYRKLEPGTRLILEADRPPRIERYWDLSALPKLDVGRAEAVHLVRDKLREAVRLRLVSEVPLGLFLSGGVDSSAILALACEALGHGPKTFSIGFDDPTFDESTWAREAARHHGADHHQLTVQPDSVELLDEVLGQYGEPYADSSCLPTWILAKMAREHVTVALTGDGGDELFAGYPRYRWLLRFGRAARFVPRALAQAAAAHLPFGRTAELLGLDDPGRVFELFSVFGTRRRRELVTFELDGEREAGEEHVRKMWRRADGGPLDRILGTEARTYLPDDLLVKMDIATMAHSLEARSPLLDHELVELVFRLPPELKLDGRRSKALLKDAVADAYPPGFLERPKRGLGVPLVRWLRGDVDQHFARELRGGALARSGLVRPDVVERLLGEHRAGAAEHQHRIFALFSLSRFLDGRGA